MLGGRLGAVAEADQVGFDLGHLGDELIGDVGLLRGEAQGRYAHLVDEAARAAVARVSDDLGV